MIKLRNRRQPGPGGFLYHEKRTGWKNWEHDPTSVWDFGLLCQRYQEHAKANPGLAMATDMKTIEDQMDLANALRYAQIPGADIYITRTGESAPKMSAPQRDRQGRGVLANVVARARNLDAGRKTLSEWWGEGGKPVEQNVADERAKVCAARSINEKGEVVGCPQNGKGGLLAKFTVPTALKIQESLEEMNDQELTTPHDSLLGTCEACDCVLRLKVWTPLPHILNHMPPETKDKLDPKCWIL